MADVSGLRVAYRLDRKGYAGKLINYTEHGGFVAADRLPEIGSRVQMAVVGTETQKPVWLDLRVTWVNTEPRGNIRVTGFGGQWLHACSKVDRGHLLDFLNVVLGLASPDISEKPNANKGASLFLYNFPLVSEQAAPPPESPQEAPDPFKQNTGGFTAPETFTNLPVITDVNLPVAPTEDLEAGDDGGSRDSRIMSLVKRLSGIRLRGASQAGPVDLDFDGHNRLVIFRIAKQAFSANVAKVGTAWLKMETDDEPPELWTRIKIEIPMPSSGKGRSAPLEVQATVTRIKDLSVKTEDVLKGIVRKGLYCKINRVDEKGQMGAFKQYIDSFGGSDSDSVTDTSESGSAE